LAARALIPLFITLSLVHAVDSSAAWAATPDQETTRPAPVTLDVPYVPQTDALCGGAAAAMVFRYWGDAHAGAEAFAPLVDRRAGGIADNVLVHAIAARGWKTERIAGSIDALGDQIAQKHPVIILLQDRPAFYHYLVVIGVEADAVVVHDPSWGPSRRIATAEFIRLWRPAGFWALVVRPAARSVTDSTTADPVPAAPPAPASVCDARLAQAVDQVREKGLSAADAEFGAVSAACPDAAGPLRELAGVRFAQHRWAEAADLAARAIARDATDAYAWEVLASSRFVQDDVPGALRAWNAIGQPRIDEVHIDGLHHMRYQLAAELLGLAPNAVLTPDAFERASRRLAELPDRVASRIGLRPAADGYAVVDVAIAEREARPRGPFEWGAAAAKAVVNREVDVGVPGFTGQGELWSAGWRWWTHRPRAAFAFEAPRTGWLPGVWRVDASWESQQYLVGDARAAVDETRTHAGVSVGDWPTGHLRYRIAAGFDAWNGARRTASAGAEIERRFARDRVGIAAEGTAFAPLSGGSGFRAAGVHLDARTSANAVRWVLTATGGVDAVSSAAPFALWPGAGDGHARAALLRAHPLLDDGAIAGPAFGRTLAFASGEVRRWIDRASPVRFGIAAFTDVARAADRLPGAVELPWQIDAGVGVRIRVPGTPGTLRADYAHGLRDGANAFTVGWQY